MSSPDPAGRIVAETVRVRGIVQGVGFRPAVWRHAREFKLRGAVWNDAAGVVIEVWGTSSDIAGFLQRLTAEAPPLANITEIERSASEGTEPPPGFSIVQSRPGEIRTDVPPDAATCAPCSAEIQDPGDRRYRYPFTNCTHCGPRLSIIRGIPYDRCNTSMSVFSMCARCRREYGDPADRRFHAQPNACPACGPEIWLEDGDGQRIPREGGADEIALAQRLITAGRILAVKGIGGIHLACDARNPAAVAALRARKRRYQKAFALMAADVAMVRRYARVSGEEASLLESPAAPIVVLDAEGETLPGAIAPEQGTLGFMLPYTPLHRMLTQGLPGPIVLTSGNRSDEPQAVDNDDGRRRLDGIADYLLLHDREIVNRLDDSVCRFMAGKPRMLRRARGYAPAPIPLPPGFSDAPDMLAMGAELKNTFCLTREGRALLSQHMGDLEDAATFDDFRRNLELYRGLFDHVPQSIAVDLHPDYLSTKHGEALAEAAGLRVEGVQHHHAHIAACMAEQGVALGDPAVLGVALDGLGFGGDGTLWGGEFMECRYGDYRRLARFRPVALPGGAMAMREPWRNTFAHLEAAFGWETVASAHGDIELVRFLEGRPLDTVRTMIVRGINSPLASSAGRLFDAVAGALGISRARVLHEGQAAIELENLASRGMRPRIGGYTIDSERGDTLFELRWESLWREILADLDGGVDRALMAARFHNGLADSVAGLAAGLCSANGLETVVLSVGVFQNRVLLEGVFKALDRRGLRVLAPIATPANDGGISLGQAAVAAARALAAGN